MKKFSLRVSGSRIGSDVRPVEGELVRPALTQPRFGLKVHVSPLAKTATPISPDDYATAEDYASEPVPLGCDQR
jgi:hypothetical protein